MQIIANFSQMLVSVNTRNIGRLMKIKSEHNMNVSEDYPFPTKAEMWVQLKAHNHQYLIYLLHNYSQF